MGRVPAERISSTIPLPTSFAMRNGPSAVHVCRKWLYTTLYNICIIYGGSMIISAPRLYYYYYYTRIIMAVPKQKDINHITKLRRRSCRRRCECACRDADTVRPCPEYWWAPPPPSRWRFRRYVSFINRPTRNVRDDYWYK